MNNDHPWLSHEQQLQKIRKLIETEPQSRELCDLIAVFHPFVVFAATRILSSPRLRYSDRDPEDAAQRWWLVMQKVGFKKYDPTHGPLFPYAYAALARVCCGNRAGRLRQTKDITFDTSEQTRGPSDCAGKREWDAAFRRAVRSLPKKPRRAFILKYVLQKSSKDGAQRCGITNIATFNTLTHVARTLLREQLNPRDWIEEQPAKRLTRHRRNYLWKDDRGNPYPKESSRDARSH